MKRQYFFGICLAMLMLLQACNRAPHPHLDFLVEADSLSATDPKLAIRRLDSLFNTIALADSSEQMYYLLLRIKAQDRAYIRHTSDHEILQVIDYYERHPEADLLAWAYCYGGRVYRDLDDTPRALHYLQLSLAELADGKNPNLRQRVLSQVGYLFYYQHLFDESRAIRREVIAADSLLGNYTKMVSSYTDIARCYIAEHRYDSAALYAEYAEQLVRQHQLTDEVARTALLKAQILEYRGEHEEAVAIVTPYLQQSSEAASLPYLAVASRALLHQGRYAEAEPLCRQLLNSKQSRLQTKADAAKHLSLISRQQGRTHETMEYQGETIRLIDSLLQSGQQEHEVLVSSYYKNMERERQMQQLQQEKREAQHRFYLALSVVIVMLMSALLLWLQYKRHQAEAMLHKEKALLQFKSTELCQRIYSLYYAQQPIPASLWGEIEECIEDIFPHFLTHLRNLCTWGETEWRITLLSCLDFRNIEIATLLCKHKSAISLAKKRLYHKVKGSEGKAEDWDNYIKSIL